MDNQTSEQDNPSSEEDTPGEPPGQHPGQLPEEPSGQLSVEFPRPPPGLPPQKPPSQRLEEHPGQVLREPCEQLAEVPPGQLPVEPPSQLLKEPPGQWPGSEESPRQRPGEPHGQSSGQLQEEPPSQLRGEPQGQPSGQLLKEPSTQRQEEPPGQLLQEPSSQRQEEPSRQRQEEPSRQRQEEPSRQRQEEPSRQRQEEPSRQRQEEPSRQRQEEPSSQRLEEPPSKRQEPSSQRQEEPPGQLLEEPSTQRQEEPSSQRLEEPPSKRQEEPPGQLLEEPSSQRQEEPSRQLLQEPSSKRQEEPLGQLLEEPSSQRQEPPTPRQLSGEIPEQPPGPVPDKKKRPKRFPRKHEGQSSGSFPEKQSKTRPEIPPRKPKESCVQLSEVAPEQPSVQPSRETPFAKPSEKTSEAGAKQTEGDALKNLEKQDARHDHPLNNHWKTEENFEKAPLATEKQNLKPFEVSFYLHVPRFHADIVTIQFSHETRKLDLKHVTKKGDGDLWRITTSLNVPDNGIRYRYSVSKSEGWFIGKQREETEGNQRSAEATIQYDTFFSSTDNNDMQKENLAKSSIFYAKWLLDSITTKNIMEVLIQIEKMNFRCAHDSHLKSTVASFLKRCDKDKVPIQRLYLCIVLGHLAYSNRDTFSLPSDKSTTNFDLLLESFEDSSFYKLLPSSSDKIVKAIAPHLVLHSSRPGWLTFAAYFYRYLGVENVVNQKAIAVEKCDAYNFWELLILLIPALKINEETQLIHRDLLKMLISTAPDCEVVSILFGTNYFATVTDKENVFLEFFQARFRNCSGKLNSGENLVELTKVPKELLLKMHEEVYALLLDLSMSTDDPKEVHIEAFCKLATLQSCFMPWDKLEIILEILSHSNVPRLHDLVLDLLDDKNFEQQWRQVPLKNKVDHCYAWILKTLADENGSREKDAKKIARAYLAMEQLMSCTLNDANKELAKTIFQNIVEHFKTVKRSAFLKAYKSIEGYSDIVQECCKNHIGTLLRQDPLLIKMAVAEINMSNPSSSQSSSTPVLSKIGQDILLCVLKIIVNSESKRDTIVQEEDLKVMLKLSDVWKTLLTATGHVKKLHDDRRFKDGKQYWLEFASRVKHGNLSPQFLNDVEQQKEILSFICATVTAKSNITEAELLEEKQVFATCISELANSERNCEKNFELLQSVIEYGIKVSEDVYPVKGIPGMDELKSEFKQCRDKWQSRELVKAWNDDSWGIRLSSLLKSAKTLSHLINSESFRNLAVIRLKEIHVDYSNIEDENCGFHDFYSFFEFLASTMVEKFSSQWNPVFSKLDELPVKTVKTLLEGLDSEESLEKEFAFLQNHFRRAFSSDVKHYIKSYVRYPSVLKQVNDLLGLLGIFQLNDPSIDESCSKLESFKSLEDDNKLTLGKVHKAVDDVQEVVSGVSGDVIEELCISNELVEFVEEIVTEDIRFLIDAVEEYSDQFVSESSVSKFIEVHGFLAPLIKKRNEECNASDFISTLKTTSEHYQDIALKVRECSTNVNTLRGLYRNSVANREEITKEIIANCLKEDMPCAVSLTLDGVCEVTMSYTRKDQEIVNYSLSDLHDLRSRAHLIVNSEKKAVEANADVDFAEFINQVNLLTEITSLLLKLQQSSGYVKYRKFWFWINGTSVLQDRKKSLEEELESWQNILSSARKQSYFLNYYRSDQLRVLYHFIVCGASEVKLEDVLSLIHFVDPSITKKKLEAHRKKICETSQEDLSHKDPHGMISSLGDALEKVFAKTRRVVRPMFKRTDDENPISSSVSQIHSTVQPGKLFVANLEEKSQLTANVILTLYENTSNAFPEPYQVVFCTPRTIWEEIHLALQRCFAQAKKLDYDSLFCIANVECLANEIQFKLVNAIEEVQNGLKQPEKESYRLALICCGGDHHHIVERFSQYAHRIAGMSDTALSERLVSTWPEVSMVTSSLPGLGKTERIKEKATKKGKNIITFPISGPLHLTELVQRLKGVDLKEYHCLHLHVGCVDDPLWLDTFLFQLIVIGMVSSGTQFYHLPTKHVFIEVANTLKDSLRDSMVICKYFTRFHLQWQNYEDLVVSSEITSNIQIVCHYFDANEKGRLESEEIHFTGPNKVKPLPAKQCRALLATCFSSNVDITFTVLNTFLAVLADQLLKFSRCAFFKIDHLKFMLDNRSLGVRTKLFIALLNVSKEFASRSIATCHPSHSDIQGESAEAFENSMSINAISAKYMVERVDTMIHWEDSNHLLVVFHGSSSQTITAVYRNKSLVPLQVENLLTSQVVKRKKELDDFKVMSQAQLQEKLEMIVCTKPAGKDTASNVRLDYVLTPDNIIKMILIILRVRANVPVIIMGETGCGKTSLVRYLADTCQIPFVTYNFHAGITAEDVVRFIEDNEKNVKELEGQQRWVFLDEINTCDQLGLINDVMCHHSLLGRPLSRKLVFLAACNPYKLRPTEHIKTAGLEGKNITDEYSKLVYRVHPLPEAMLDYVWDYGSLAPEDEKAYIERMVKSLLTLRTSKKQNLLVDLLVESQTFVREAEKNHFCVSLRDVYRCILLTKWFEEITEKRRKVKSDHCPVHLTHYSRVSKRYGCTERSIVLALAHCYQSRLPTADLRRRYQSCMMILFCSHGTIMKAEEETNSFSAIVRMEEEDYLGRMELPAGTARNAALRENLFVMLVCILNRIPVFVVGKPGCSKSLSIQLIRSNLRGRDSKDAFFKKLPHLYVVSYQGSESSTSEGIIKVFEKARKYKSHNKGGSLLVLPVVLIDEVGLAENSKYNPLKVLHSQLEPGHGKRPDVAVVGISNWSLDAAKMNRAIHLSRPDPDKEDLYETGQSLLNYTDCTGMPSNWKGKMSNDELQCLAEGYFEYQSKQPYANFHGLRDYYSLIKSLRGGSNLQQINVALQRNFGGIHDAFPNIQKIFLDKLKSTVLNISSVDGVIPVNKLIQENLSDPLGRHLMLITNGDSAIGILKQNLAQQNKDVITMFGSRFEEDLSEEYNYRMLSQIILYMERDCILILRDLESIYGSLYDMLNQNYAVVGKRKNCRVALGANSNPLCQVNDGFRCIVLKDSQKVNNSDPPFLNRFEKQLLRFSDVLNDRQQTIIGLLGDWVQKISTIQDHESHFNETNMFIGYHEDTLPSLVLLHGQNPEDADEDIIEKCKDDLMWIAASDGVLRTHVSAGFKDKPVDVNKLCGEYFKKPIHSGLPTFIEASTNEESPAFQGDEIGVKAIVMTFSNIHTNILKCLGDNVKCQVERLGAYKSEKQFTERVNHFWTTTSEDEILVMQCKPELDAGHMLLARSIIENKRVAYQQEDSYQREKRRKHVYIIVHVHREATTNMTWQFNFLCGWKQVFLDILEAPQVPLNTILSASVTELLNSRIWSLQKIAQDVLMWCFTCIKYKRQQRQLESIFGLVKNLFKSNKVYMAIEKLIIRSINAHGEKEGVPVNGIARWQIKIACDRQALVNFSTLYGAMEYHASQLVRQPLAKIIYFLEKENAWPPHVLSEWNDDVLKTAYEEMWCKLILSEDIFKIAEIPEPRGAESYTLDGVNLELRFPFSQLFISRIDGVKELFLKDHAQLQENEDNREDQLQQMERFSDIISKIAPEVEEFPPKSFSCYMNDIFDVTSRDFNTKMNREQRVSTIKSAYVSHIKQSVQGKNTLHLYVQLHAFVWIHKEQILDLVRMVVSCLPFVNMDVAVRLTDEFLSSHSDVLTHVINDGPDTSSVKSDQDDLEHTSEGLPKPGNIADDQGNDNAMLTKLQEENEKIGIDKEDNESREEHSDEVQECFADILVTAYCEKMLPSQGIIEKQNGLKSWVRNSCLLLSLASKISYLSPAFHFLRLSVDLARILTSLSIPEKEMLHQLRILKEIGDSLKPEYLEAMECFEKINEYLIKHLQKEVKLKFSALFFARCIDSNAEAYSVPEIVEHVLTKDQPDLVLMMRPVMLRLLLIEELDSPGIFIEIIAQPTVIEKHPCLHAIDQGFKNLSTKKGIHCDSYPAVMICDLVHSILNLHSHLSIEDFNSSDSKMLSCVKKAASILSDAEPMNCGLTILSAVAFLRWFFSLLSRFIAESSTNVLKYETPYTILMNDINSILTTMVHYGVRRSTLQLFFLKQLRQHNSLFDLSKLCCESEMLPALKMAWSSDKSVDKAKLIFACELEEYQQVKSAYRKLVNENSQGEMLAFLEQCHQSSNHRLALLGILANMIYVKRAERKLTDREEHLVGWFGDNSKHFHSPLKDLLLRLIGLKDFKSDHLQLSSASSVDEVETALLVIHISCVIASGIQDDAVPSPLYQYFTKPLECQDTFVLALGEERKQQMLRICEVPTSPFTCICGLRSIFNDCQQDNRCPNCTKTHQPACTTDIGGSKPECTRRSTKGYSSVIPLQESPQSAWDICMDQLSPSVFRALHMIVHASLYAGVAIELTTKKDLSLLLRLEKSSSKADDDCLDPQQLLFEQVVNDLKNLTVILACKKEIAVKVMHRVIESCTDLIRGSEGLACASEEERQEWEVKFSNTSENVLQQALAPKQQELENQSDSLENKIGELDEYPSHPDDQKQQLKRLFRLTKEPTFEDFRANFINRPKHFQERHRFLSLFFAHFEKLPLISNLYHLLKWTRLVSTTLSYRISREEAHKTISMNDFIHGQLNDRKLNRTDREKESLKKLLSDFENAWNNMHELVNDKLDPEDKKMPRMTENSEIAYCLIETECGVYLHTALKILTSLQNTILDELLFLSVVHDHPALSFFEKDANCSGVSSVSLQDAKEKDIISFQWSNKASKLPNAENGIDQEEGEKDFWCDKLFKYANNNPEYGKGEEIHYDFEQIEIVLAKDFAFGKCHLTVSFNKFIFAKEFFHSCGPLLSEIRELYPESPSLPDDVRQGLDNLKECRIKEAQNLLQQIEVLIVLLKQVKCDGEMTLESFAEKWFSMLPSPFPVSLLPQPSDSIKLKHITVLYEALEDMLADGAIKAIPKQFRVHLTEGMQHQLDNLVDNDNKLPLTAFINALRRFVFRYLSSEKFLPESKTTLSSCLKEPSLWSSCTKPPDPWAVIPKDLTLTYLHSIISHLQDLEKKRKSNLEESSQRRNPQMRVLKKGKKRSMQY